MSWSPTSSRSSIACSPVVCQRVKPSPSQVARTVPGSGSWAGTGLAHGSEVVTLTAFAA